MLFSILLFFFSNFLLFNATGVEILSDLPIYESADFRFKVSTNLNVSDKNPFNAVVLITYQNRERRAHVILMVGIARKLDPMVNNIHFILQKYEMNAFGDLYVSMKFYKAADQSTMKIFLVSAKNKIQFNEIFKNFSTKARFIDSVFVELQLQWRMRIEQRTLDGQKGGVLMDMESEVACIAEGGRPWSRARLELGNNSDMVTIVKRRFDIHSNMDLAVVRARKEAHGQVQVVCSTLLESVNETLRVLHGPTIVKVLPAATKLGFVRPGSTLQCISEGGYPASNGRWRLSRGHNGSIAIPAYLKIKGEFLYVDVDATLKTQWHFNCDSDFNLYSGIIRKLEALPIKFVIGEAPVSNIVVIGTAAAGTIILLAIITLACALCRYRRKQKSSSVDDEPNNASDPTSKDFSPVSFPLSDHKDRTEMAYPTILKFPVVPETNINGIEVEKTKVTTAYNPVDRV